MRHFLVFSVWVMVGTSLVGLDVSPVVPVPTSTVVARLPWAPADEVPLWNLTGDGIASHGSGRQTESGLEVTITVDDPAPTNTFAGRHLWRGDSLQLTVDGRGDGWSQGPDDVVVLVGRGTQGAESWVIKHGLRARVGALPTVVRGVDELPTGLRYRVFLPWDLLGSGPGLVSHLGMAATIAHKDSQNRDLTWGSPTALHAIALDDPRHGEPLLAAGLPVVLSTTTAQVAVPPGAERRLEVAMGSEVRSTTIPAGAWGRYRIALAVEDLAPGNSTLRCDLREGTATTWTTAQPYGSLVLSEIALLERIAVLRAARDPATAAVVGWYLESLEACLGAARVLRPLKSHDPAWLAHHAETLALLLKKLPTERVDLALHQRRGLPLVGAFVSQADDTLQFYTLQLPFAWDPAVPAPITVYLHGKGTPYTMGALALAYDTTQQDTLFRDQDIDPAAVPPLHRGFVLAPWARGNAFYEGPAGKDVFQALADVESRFRIDPDRRRLTGFSMGGSGTLRLATYRPDLWAGINVAAGFMNQSYGHVRGLRNNLRHLPMTAWCGTLDVQAQKGEAQAWMEEMRQSGFDLTTRLAPDLPHTYPFDEYNRMLEPLLEQRRRSPPDRWSFRTDDFEYPGGHGIVMRLGRQMRGSTAGFTYVREGTTITLTSDGCPGIALDLPRLGLGNVPEVVIQWNGAEAFRGPPGQVFLPERFEIQAKDQLDVR